MSREITVYNGALINAEVA